MLLLKKVTNASDIPSKDVPFAEQNIYLLAQDAENRQIFGRQTANRTKNWANSFFITPLEFCAKLKSEIHFQGSLQTATIELMLKFNMRGNAVGMYDWIHRNNLTSLSEDDLTKALHDFAPGLTAELEGHFARTNDMRLGADEIAAAFPSWLQPTQVRSLKIGALESRQEEPTQQAQPTPPQPVISVPMAEVPKDNSPQYYPPLQTQQTTQMPQLQTQQAHPPFVVRTASPTPVVARQPQRPPKRRRKLIGCCNHLLIIMFLIVCIVVGGILKLCKVAVNAISAAVSPIVDFVCKPSEKTAANGDRILLQLPQGIPLELLKTKAGSFQPVSPVSGVQTTSYQINIPQDFWVTEHEITNEQWQTMMSAPLNTFGVGLDEANEFCRRLNQHFADRLPSGYHFALPTDAEWNLAVMQHKKQLVGKARRIDVLQTRLYGFHLAIVPNAP